MLSMVSYVDNILDRITMYRLLLYYLIALVLIAFGLSFTPALHFKPVAIVISTTVLFLTCLISNKVFAFIFEAPTSFESVYITALILSLIIAPVSGTSIINYGFLVAAGGLAMASKYLLTIRRKHLFNPAAIAAVLTSLGPKQSADWWVGTAAMLPFVLIGGLLLARKIRRMQMVATFFSSALLATIVYTLLTKGNVYPTLSTTLLSSSLFFLGFVMLTEPLTTPPTKAKQTWYAVLVGIVFPPQFHILTVYSTPEMALIVGNVFSYLMSPKTKLFPTLREKMRLTADSIDFVFSPNQQFAYQPGQYMEWTLPHAHMDARGDRRRFTLASSPTEPSVRLGVKFYKGGSSYKRALRNLTPQTPIVADQIMGDFVLPKNKAQKLVFIAGGIGITPYRSMTKYLLDKRERRDVILLYSARSSNDFAYQNVFRQASQQLGMKVIYTVTDEQLVTTNATMRSGRIDETMINTEVADYQERLFYISGTQTMVKAIHQVLTDLGIPRKRIKIDYFSGYA